MEVFIDLYIFTALLKFLTHVEHLSNRGVSEENIGFKSKKVIKRYYVLYISYMCLRQLSWFDYKNLIETL